MTTDRNDAKIVRTLRRLLRERGAGKTICPSEVARALVPEGASDGVWRQLMPKVRAVGRVLAAAGEVVFMQRGKVVDPKGARGPIRLAMADIAKTKYADRYRGIDFRKHPELYVVGKGEQGVLIAEPYKTELLPLWRFRNETVARESSLALWKAFVGYRKERDFVGMDMARKFLQMGFTRARRYANRSTGRKYERRDVGRPAKARARAPLSPDEEKAKAAAVFYEVWQKAERDRVYAKWREEQRAARHAAPSEAS